MVAASFNAGMTTRDVARVRDLPKPHSAAASCRKGRGEDHAIHF